MALRSIESRLPPGFRFHPNDEELVCHYLCKKVANEEISGVNLVDVNLHDLEPWELPDEARLSANEWYFFSFRELRYATGSRTNRATRTGYWKATGKDRNVYEPTGGGLAGMRKTLVFYGGRAPSGLKTGWIMHEFRLVYSGVAPRGDWVLCRVFNKDKEETAREGPENWQNGDGFSFVHPSTSYGTHEGYARELALYSGFADLSSEMEAEPPLPLDGGGCCGDGELEFFLDVKEFNELEWGNQP